MPRRARRFWMTVNFSLTFAVAVLRGWVGIVLAFGNGAFEPLYSALTRVGWFPNIIVGVLIAPRSHATGRPRRPV